MSIKKIVSKACMHSCLVKKKFTEAVIVKERTLYDDGSTSSRLATYVDPKRSFYMTQKRYRDYKYKIELEDISKLDKFTVKNIDLRRKLAEVLGLRPGYHKDAVLFRSPYIFGADISIESLIKMHYMNTFEIDIPPTYGFLDIETSIDTDEIMLISYIANGTVYLCVLDHFLYREETDTNGNINRIKVSEVEMNNYLLKSLGDYTSKLNPSKKIPQNLISTMKGLKYELKVFTNEIELIAWTFKNIHHEQVDMIGIWNMGYDIPYILDRLKLLKVSSESIFCDPTLDESFRYVSYIADKNKRIAHFTLKWDYLHCTSGSQFIDSMSLFSQVRRTAGFRAKYTLDAILDEELGLSKLPLKDGGSHAVNQRRHFMDYTVYNAFDSISLYLLEMKNNDLLAMSILAGMTPISKFAAAGIKSTNSTYRHHLAKGKILASVSNLDNYVKLDKLFSNCGGLVLPPHNVENVGICLDI